nr:hypothetical protein [Myxococcus xanthus]
MSSYAEAGVRRYRIEAVLDEATTQVCRFLHGKAFSVGEALQRFERLESLSQPEDLKQELPGGGRALLYVNRGGQETRLAEVLRSAVGTRDDVGEFRSLVSDRQLAEVGVGFPPYHGLCRTTTLGSSWSEMKSPAFRSEHAGAFGILRCSHPYVGVL